MSIQIFSSSSRKEKDEWFQLFLDSPLPFAKGLRKRSGVCSAICDFFCKIIIKNSALFKRTIRVITDRWEDREGCLIIGFYTISVMLQAPYYDLRCVIQPCFKGHFTLIALIWNQRSSRHCIVNYLLHKAVGL